MAAFMKKGLTTAALCWRLERRDGVALGFTTHDRDLEIDGLTYRASPGMLPSSVTLTDGFAADALDVKGALTGEAISGRDLKVGRWDGAALRIFMVDWENPVGESLAIARGELGEVAVAGEAFEAELRGPTALLDRPVVEQTSPECRAQLGDKRCRVDMAARVRVTRVTAVVEETLVEVANAAAGNAYAYGSLRWIGGANSGLTSPLLQSEGPRLTLREPPELPVAPGDLVELREGCDRSLATCSGRFANVPNFRGEPHLPGIDLLTRYPGA
ncbi:MAG: DUF2163 domain-containing protein [Pseudomonadota bacterium]|nr:DUF2163 domain-containing protein [Pseudomonadota bacterium]